MTPLSPPRRGELLPPSPQLLALAHSLARVLTLFFGCLLAPMTVSPRTSWLMADGAAVVEGRQRVLSAWLNAVLMLCPDASCVVEFIAGQDGLLQSVIEAPSMDNA